jgi:23S rRNA pseudouridine1911/1915/1917 synthase
MIWEKIIGVAVRRYNSSSGKRILSHPYLGCMQTFTVSSHESGNTLLQVLRARLALSWSRTRRLIQEQQVRLNGVPCLDGARRLQRGQRLEVADRAAANLKSADDNLVIRFADAHVVVVEKPAGLTTMRHPEEAAEFGSRGRRFLPPTLADLLPARLAQGRPGKQSFLRAVHRLDKDTSGLVVFARSSLAARHLGQQFRAHSIQRSYLAVVRGRAKSGCIESSILPDRGDGRRGSTTEPQQGKRAVTHVRVVEELGDYTLVECRLETGRTHQVRIHLGESGTPLCGERIYDRPFHGRPLPDHSGAPRLALHAASLGFEHPATKKWMTWESRLPRDLADLVKRLRKK